jgi:hypothetical protein
MLRDLAIVLMGRALQMAVLLLALKAMTTALAPSEVGIFSLLVAISNLFTWLIISPFGIYVNRRTLDWQQNGTLRRNFGLHAAFIALSAILSAILILAGQHMLQPEWGVAALTVAGLVPLYILVATLSNTLAPALNLMGHRVAYSLLYTLTLLLCLAGSWFLTQGTPTGVTWFTGQIAGFAAGTGLSFAAFLFFTRRTPPEKGFTTLWGPHLKLSLVAALAFTLPVAAAWTLNWVQFQSYRVIVSELVSLDFLGLFFAGYSVAAGLMGAVEITASQFFYPHFYKHLQRATEEDRHNTWASYMSVLLPIMLLLTTALIVSSDILARMLLAGPFQHAGLFVAAGAAVECVRVVGGNYALASHATMRTTALLPPHAIGAICAVLFLTTGVQCFGEQAVPYAMLAAALAFLSAMHIAMTRHVGARVQPKGGLATAATLSALALLWLLRHNLTGLAGDILSLFLAGLVTLAGCSLLVLKAQKSLQYGN